MRGRETERERVCSSGHRTGRLAAYRMHLSQRWLGLALAQLLCQVSAVCRTENCRMSVRYGRADLLLRKPPVLDQRRRMAYMQHAVCIADKAVAHVCVCACMRARVTSRHGHRTSIHICCYRIWQLVELLSCNAHRHAECLILLLRIGFDAADLERDLHTLMQHRWSG